MALANRKIGYDEIVTRDIHFPMNQENVSRHWFSRDPWMTHWMNAILAAVPDGERWVMNSARRQLDKLQDPMVKKAAIEFIRQERIHAREHDDMNAVCVQNGIPIDKVEAVFKLIRKQLQHRLSNDMQSSIAAAFEHFTAIISSVFLEHPELFDETHPQLRAMLYWHFVEESEHKSVSYDVFVDASGGGMRGYRLRVFGMVLAIAVGIPILIGNQSFLVYKDKQLFNLSSAGSMLKTLFIKPAVFSKVLAGVIPYFSPTFHPWDDDNRALLHIWKRVYEQTGDPEAAYQALRRHRAVTHVRTAGASPVAQSA